MIAIVNCLDADVAPLFEAVTVNVELPAEVGVPVIAPVEALSVSPAGKEPAEIAQVTPDVSDVSVSV